MSSLSLAVFLTGALLPFLVIVFVWQNANWSWKVRPLIPMLLGMLVLVSAFAADLYLFEKSNEIGALIQRQPKDAPPQKLSVLSDMSRANDLLAKVLELITIPLGVALIATALSLKSELEFKHLLSDYEDRVRLWRDGRDQQDKVEQEFERSLEAGERGEKLLEHWKRVKAGRSSLVDHAMTLRKQYRALIDEDFVKPPDQRRNQN